MGDRTYNWIQQAFGYKVFDTRVEGRHEIARFKNSTEATNWCLAMELMDKLMNMTKWNEKYMRVFGVQRFIDEELASTLFFWDIGGINLKHLKEKVKGIEDKTWNGLETVEILTKRITKYLGSQDFDDFQNLKEKLSKPPYVEES